MTSVSVVIAVRNGAGTLQRALDSVYAQTFDRVEVIVMDGASTDGTLGIIQRNGAQISYWESKPDHGVYHAWNKALDHVTGEWICFLGADDRFAGPDVLARMADFLATAADRYRVVYASVEVVDNTGAILLRAGEPWPMARDEFRRRMTIPHQATMHHRSLFERYGRFDEGYRICGDYEFLLRDALDHEPLFVPDLVLVEMGSGGLSSRPENSATMTREFHRARYAHGLEGVPEWRSPAVIRAIVRAWLVRVAGARAGDAVSEVYRLVARKPRPQGKQ